MSQDGETPEPESERARLRREREHLRRLRINEAGVALAALLVSVTVIGVNAYNHRRGSQMVVLQPEQVLFYRDSGPSGSTMMVGLEAQMVNAAREYGDVVVRAALGVDEQGEEARFKLVALAESVMTPAVKRGVENCPVGARCVPATGFYVIQRPKKLLDVPGGSSRSEHLVFELQSNYCSGSEQLCPRFQDFAAALDWLRAQGAPRLSAELAFQFDGVKVMQCALTADPAMRTAIWDYLDEKGWALVACITPEDGSDSET